MYSAIRLASRFAAVTTTVGAAGFGGFLYYTRRAQFVPYEVTTDPIYSSPIYNKLNPNRNFPALYDRCVRRVPLKDIEPGLLQEEGKLVERFCAGVWSGVAYEFQRRYLERKYRGSDTAYQLWDNSQLSESTYPVGQHITDHFEVLWREPNSIGLRCGDSPRIRGVRTTDGIIELTATVKPDEGVAEFEFTCVFFQGEGKSDAKMPEPIAFLHRLYTKFLVEDAVGKIYK